MSFQLWSLCIDVYNFNSIHRTLTCDCSALPHILDGDSMRLDDQSHITLSFFAYSFGSPISILVMVSAKLSSHVFLEHEVGSL